MFLSLYIFSTAAGKSRTGLVVLSFKLTEQFHFFAE